MASKQTSLKARNGNSEITAQHTTTDSPILPIEQLDRLREIAPTRVEWVFDQTEVESNFRRSETRRVNTFTFIERIAGLVLGLIALGLIVAATVYLAIQGHDTVAGVFGGVTLVGIVTAFVTGRKNKD